MLDSAGGRGAAVFTAVKYLTYSLVALNVYLFFREETGSLEHTFSGALGFDEIVQVFAATLDTISWFVLLLLFELETYVLDDARLHGGLKRTLHGVRGVAYIGVLYAFSGYYAELATLYQTVPLADGWEACAQLADDWSVLQTLDQYVPLDAANCAALQAPLAQVEGFQIVSETQPLASARYLAWTDVINAGAWILVVVVLEIEVRLQLRGRLTDRIVGGLAYLKYALYATLLGAAVYWGFAGTFLDFWDAFLWLFAFVFIELNVFSWQRESQEESAAASA